jgi:hypothetical protein
MISWKAAKEIKHLAAQPTIDSNAQVTCD